MDAPPSHEQKKRLRTAARAFLTELCERQRWRCYLCKRAMRPKSPGVQPEGNDATIDHVKPLSQGGTNDKGNLKAACYRCNLKKDRQRSVTKCPRCGQAKHRRHRLCWDCYTREELRR